MNNYNYSVLNDKEFEELILSANIGFHFNSYKTGRDRGINLCYSTDAENEIVVQCKHYSKSYFNELKYDTKNLQT
jgi:hypothetical protein